LGNKTEAGQKWPAFLSLRVNKSMLNDIVEFLFCPVHGVFAVSRWPVVMPALSAGVLFVKQCLGKK
jgi:hypothetical protein